MTDGIYLKEMGNKIKAARTANKLSLRKLSAMCGIDMSAIWFIEQGRKNVHILTLKSIAESLNVDVRDFI